MVESRQEERLLSPCDCRPDFPDLVLIATGTTPPISGKPFRLNDLLANRRLALDRSVHRQAVFCKPAADLTEVYVPQGRLRPA